jgi:hypothetical protein
LLFVVLYYIKNKLNKTGAVIQPWPKMIWKRSSYK